MQLAASQIARALAERLAQTASRRRPDPEVVGTGCTALDGCFPRRGLTRGSLVEWLGVGQGSGASSLALALAWQACQQGGMLVVVDRRRLFYPPAILAWGVPAERLLVVRPENERDLAWSMDQILRSPSVGAAVAWPETIGDHTFRRWQLAAESGSVIGMLVRPAGARAGPTWAELRWLVTPLPSRLPPATGDLSSAVGNASPAVGNASSAVGNVSSAVGNRAAAERLAPTRRMLRLELLRRRGGCIELLPPTAPQVSGTPPANIAAPSRAEPIDLEFEPFTGRLHETNSLYLAAAGRRGA